MRAFYIPAAVLAAILAFSLWTGRCVQRDTERWTAALSESGREAREENWEAAAARLDEAYSGWSRSQGFLHTIMDHAELDEVEELFAGALAVCQEQDEPDFHTLLSQIAASLEMLAETQRFSLRNVL
ncbi:MAG: DUF4363 family protein [Oscillospiraceae bacterium]|nr:DUF4363 family protein [Oscillospiraceae bacterium]